MSSEKACVLFARGALFLIYGWFGSLKLLGICAADELVMAVASEGVPWISPRSVCVGLGVFEVFLALAFLVPGWVRAAVALLLAHIAATLLPLAILPQLTWTSSFVPTLTGQYIVKNLALVAVGLFLVVHSRPARRWERPEASDEPSSATSDLASSRASPLIAPASSLRDPRLHPY